MRYGDSSSQEAEQRHMSSETVDTVTVSQRLAELATGTDTNGEPLKTRRASVFRYKFQEIRKIMIAI
jgi:hypothetical protein